MAKKRLFQVLDDMNVKDTDKKTRLVAVSNHVLGLNKDKRGGRVEMAIDDMAFNDLLKNTHKVVLVVIDNEEFQKRHR